MEAPKESTVNLVTIAVIGFVGYLLLKQSGLLKLSSNVVNALDPVFAGDAGYNLGGIGATPATPTTLPGQGLASWLTGGQSAADIINVPVTDAAFAKMGVTTSQVYYLNSKYGPALFSGIMQKRMRNDINFTAAENTAMLEAGISQLIYPDGSIVRIGQYSVL